MRLLKCVGVAASLVMFSGLAAQADNHRLDNGSARQLIERAERIAQLARERAHQLDQRQTLRAISQFNLVEQTLLGGGPVPPGPGPGPGPNPPGPFPPQPPFPPGPARSLLDAECHVDDDPQFDFGQSIAGRVRGGTVDDLIAECQSLAQASYGAKGTSGLKDIKVLQADQAAVFAECHLDDDAQFDFGQIVVGTLAAYDFVDAIHQCKRLAAATYGAKGSAGIKHQGFASAQPFLVSGECNLDDDASFDMGQIIFGEIRGNTVRDVVAQCAAIATETYGANGSSGVRNIKQP